MFLEYYEFALLQRLLRDVLGALHAEYLEEIGDFLAVRGPPEYLINGDAAALGEARTHHIRHIHI